jgi:transposase
MALPQLTDEQRKAALKKATETREKRAELSRQLKAGKVKAADLIKKSDDPIIGRMKVSRLIESLPGLGKVRSKQIMEELGIDPSRRVGGLGSRQREALQQRLS